MRCRADHRPSSLSSLHAALQRASRALCTFCTYVGRQHGSKSVTGLVARTESGHKCTGSGLPALRGLRANAFWPLAACLGSARPASCSAEAATLTRCTAARASWQCTPGYCLHRQCSELFCASSTAAQQTAQDAGSQDAASLCSMFWISRLVVYRKQGRTVRPAAQQRQRYPAPLQGYLQQRWSLRASSKSVCTAQMHLAHLSHAPAAGC